MDALRLAAPLARLLLALGETGREGELHLEQGNRSARVSITRGRVVALQGVDVPPLGDTLLALGALDVVSQRSLLSCSDGLRVGARLVAAGATSSRAVQRALELQLAHGLDALLRWPPGKTELRPAADTASGSFVSVDLVSTVWSSLLGLAATLPEASLHQLSGRSALVLSAAGEKRVRSLLHAADSGALASSHLRRTFVSETQPRGLASVITEASLRAALLAANSRDDHALRAVLRVLGVATRLSRHEDSYALLLRKTRELARNASENVLLDLPARSSAAHARAALRRLAGKLHPDRFQADDARLHAVSSRVMGALAQAEHRLRVAGLT